MTQKYTKEQLKQLAVEAASRHGIDPQAYLAQIEQESGWNVNAKSKAGARGLAQFMPATAKEYKVNVNDPVSSLDKGALYMAKLKGKYSGNEDMARLAYNWGQGNVDKYLSGEGKPVPKEAQEYNAKIYSRMGKEPPKMFDYPEPTRVREAAGSSPSAKTADATPAMGAGVGGVPAGDTGVFAAAATELAQGLPPGTLTQAAAPAAPSWQDQLQSLSTGAPAVASAQPADLGVLDSLTAGDELAQRARNAQNSTLGRMFADMGVTENPDVPALPAGVDRYLDKILA